MSMGKRVVHCGDIGSGQAAKLANNLVLAVTMAGVAEGLAYGQRQGLDPVLLTSIFNSSSAQCWSSEKYNPVPGVMPDAPSSRNYQAGFGTAMMLKDLRLALKASKQCEARLPMTDEVLRLYEKVEDAAGGEIDFSAIYEYVYNR
jgi:3-hydroxyisobutyrate dehydrogenase